ncbi:MAG: Maf family protein, partial [FCB group bacterium]|nr:Maf family protein [FCB group bacterium]
GQVAEGYETTDVTFRDLTSDEIAHFVHAVRPTDRAGAYTVDGPGSLIVARYDGCYQNVLGLPIVRLDLLLRTFGLNLFELMDGERSVFL